MTKALTHRVTLLGIFCAGLAWSAAAQAPSADFTASWTASRKHVRTGPGGKYEARIYERWVHAGDVSYVVGNVTHFRFPKAALPKGQAFNRHEAAEKLRVAMGLAAWRKREQGAASVFEAEWTRADRFVRVFVSETKDSIAYDIALYRMAYAEEMAFESELLLRQLSGALETRLPWLDRMTALLELVIPVAHAGPAPAPACPVCAPGDAVCAQMASACLQQAQLQQQITQIYASTSQMNAQGQAANTNWADTNREIRRSNDLLRDFIQPENAFLWAAAGAAGAAAGALAVSLAVDAIAAGGAAIYEAITHEKEEARILERFAKARELWEKTSQAAADLERTIDTLFRAREVTRSFGIPRGELVRRLGTFRALKSAELRRANQALDDALARGDDACAARLAGTAGFLTELVAEVERLREHMDDPQGDQQFCVILRRQLEKLREAEGQLQTARASILAGQQVWLRRWNEEYNRSADEYRSARSQAEGVHREALEAAAKRRDRAMREQLAIWDREVHECMRRRAPIILRDIPLIGMPIRLTQRGACREEVSRSPAGVAYFRRKAEIENAYYRDVDEAGRERTAAGRRADSLYMHNPTRTEELAAYNRWFDSVRDEQACLMDAQACRSPVSDRRPSGSGAESGEPAIDRGSLLTRFEAISRKANRIDTLCGRRD
jgi:hypothetical protein